MVDSEDPLRLIVEVGNARILSRRPRRPWTCPASTGPSSKVTAFQYTKEGSPVVRVVVQLTGGRAFQGGRRRQEHCHRHQRPFRPRLRAPGGPPPRLRLPFLRPQLRRRGAAAAVPEGAR